MVESIYEKLSKERKEGQEQGKYPEWYTTGAYQTFKENYEYQADGFSEQITRIAKTVARFSPPFLTPEHPFYKRITENHGTTWEDCYYSIMWNGDFQPSTPVLSNTGTDRGCSVSCSGGAIGDSIDDFYSALREAALLTKEGFGTSAYLGGVRPRGSVISSGGKATGTWPVLDDFQTMAKKVSQSGVRRGSWAGYLEIDHPDFDEWCDNLLKNPAGLNIGWIVSKEVIQKWEDGDVDMHRRRAKALHAKMVTGKGYFWKIDHVNEQQPECYKKHGLYNKASNLCVAPETMILTRQGYLPIAELEDCVLDIWNGEEWSEVSPTKTGENQKLLKVTTSAGQILECTEYHKWYVFTDYGKPFAEKRTYELKEGDKLMKFDLPVIEGDKELPYAYDNGFYSGDGCFINGGTYLYLYHEKKALKDYLPSVKNWRDHAPNNRLLGKAVGLKDKFFVPTNEYSIKARLDWFAGYLDADGCVYRNGTNEAITASSVNFTFLQEIQLMLQTLGVSCKISKLYDAGIKQLPANDGSGLNKDYLCQESYRLLITSYDSFKLVSLGLKTNRLKIDLRRPQRDAKQFNKIVSVVDEGRYDDAWCFTEHKRGMGMFNGILTGNCTEIVLFSDLMHTYSCIISSMNCVNYDRYKNTGSVFIAIVFLDSLCSEFLDKARKIPGLEKVVRYTEKARSLGLGLLGYHSYLQENMLAFEEYLAHRMNIEIFSHLREEAEEATKWLAETLGEPEWCKGFNRRNTHLLACAPNVSSATLAGQVSQGIGPWYANAYLEPTASGELMRINPVFLRLAKERKKYNKALVTHVTNNKGSVQDLDWLTDHEKLVLKTAFEIDQRAILRKGSKRQEYIDQGQSLNLHFSSDESEEYIAEIHKEFFLDPYLKGAYYIRSESGIQASKDTCIACES